MKKVTTPKRLTGPPPAVRVSGPLRDLLDHRVFAFAKPTPSYATQLVHELVLQNKETILELVSPRISSERRDWSLRWMGPVVASYVCPQFRAPAKLGLSVPTLVSGLDRLAKSPVLRETLWPQCTPLVLDINIAMDLVTRVTDITDHNLDPCFPNLRLHDVIVCPFELETTKTLLMQRLVDPDARVPLKSQLVETIKPDSAHYILFVFELR